jgi:hypothetical protein
MGNCRALRRRSVQAQALAPVTVRALAPVMERALALVMERALGLEARVRARVPVQAVVRHRRTAHRPRPIRHHRPRPARSTPPARRRDGRVASVHGDVWSRCSHPASVD